MDMRNHITLYDDQYKFYKSFGSIDLLIAFIDYMFEDIEPTGLTEQEMILFDSMRVRMDNQKKRSNAGKKGGKKSHGGGAKTGNKNAVKNWKSEQNNKQTTNKTTSKQQTKQQANNKQDNITNVILLDIPKGISIEKEKKEKDFDNFWREYPHARKGKKADSKMYFLKQDPDEVMKQVQILKRKLRAGLIESQYIPACERWIRDFTPINDDVVKQDLLKICRWHLNAGGDMKQRASELKQVFGEQQISEIVKSIQQKNSPKNLFLNSS